MINNKRYKRCSHTTYIVMYWYTTDIVLGIFDNRILDSTLDFRHKYVLFPHLSELIIFR
jgi:hypothetical protein